MGNSNRKSHCGVHEFERQRSCKKQNTIKTVDVRLMPQTPSEAMPETNGSQHKTSLTRQPSNNESIASTHLRVPNPHSQLGVSGSLGLSDRSCTSSTPSEDSVKLCVPDDSKNRRYSTPSIRSRSRDRSGSRRPSLLLNGALRQDNNHLTDEKKQLIQYSWQLLVASNQNDVAQVGVRFFYRFFRSCPQLAPVFGVPSEELEQMSFEQLKNHERIARISRVFAMVFDLAVRNVNSLEADMSAVLKMYGRRHAQKPGFSTDYFQIYNESVSKQILDEITSNDEFDQSIEECISGWSYLLNFISTRMIEGVHEQSIRPNDNNAARWSRRRKSFFH